MFLHSLVQILAFVQGQELVKRELGRYMMCWSLTELIKAQLYLDSSIGRPEWDRESLKYNERQNNQSLKYNKGITLATNETEDDARERFVYGQYRPCTKHQKGSPTTTIKLCCAV